ncbi:MAG: hypothetical protein N2691_00185 [Patescibacteria group bacterium]|nr:hypothetical protein [Patescibacteria group bacterium]
MDEKTTGYILLTLGIVVMIFGLLQMGLTITRVIKPFPTFRFEEVFVRLPENTKTADADAKTRDSSTTTIRRVNGEIEQLQRSDVAVSPDVVNDILNTALYILFASLLSSIGYKIAQLGVRLIRPIQVTVNASDIEFGKPGAPPTYVAPKAQTTPFA